MKYSSPGCVLEANVNKRTCYAWEDLHWADPVYPGTAHPSYWPKCPRVRLLTVLTCRPEFTPSWGTHSYLSQLTLGRLWQDSRRRNGEEGHRQ